MIYRVSLREWKKWHKIYFSRIRYFDDDFIDEIFSIAKGAPHRKIRITHLADEYLDEVYFSRNIDVKEALRITLTFGFIYDEPLVEEIEKLAPSKKARELTSLISSCEKIIRFMNNGVFRNQLIAPEVEELWKPSEEPPKKIGNVTAWSEKLSADIFDYTKIYNMKLAGRKKRHNTKLEKSLDYDTSKATILRASQSVYLINAWAKNALTKQRQLVEKTKAKHRPRKQPDLKFSNHVYVLCYIWVYLFGNKLTTTVRYSDSHNENNSRANLIDFIHYVLDATYNLKSKEAIRAKIRQLKANPQLVTECRNNYAYALPSMVKSKIF